jgi:hypothetical protein
MNAQSRRDGCSTIHADGPRNPNTAETYSAMDKPGVYRIKVRGVVPDSWIDRLGGMQIVASTSGDTTLEGWLPDEAALKGVLDTLYELRLSLVDVTRL